jgi:hypothetical protein
MDDMHVKTRKVRTVARRALDTKKNYEFYDYGGFGSNTNKEGHRYR